MDLISLVETSVFQSTNAAANDPEDTPNTITQVPNPNATLGILIFEALPLPVAVAIAVAVAVVVAVAGAVAVAVAVSVAVLDAVTDPRLKVGLPGFPVDGAAGL